jgi:transposase
VKLHANAPFAPKGRLTMVLRVVEEGWSLARATEAAGVSDRTCRKWVTRYLGHGRDGLVDRSSAPGGWRTGPMSSGLRRSPHCGACA